MHLNKLAILVLLCLGVALCKTTCEKTTSIPKPLKTGEYDFIVVGGGTGGAITAARLSENFDVLLLESGPKFYDNNTQSALWLANLFWGKDLESAIGSFKLGNKIIGKINEFGTLVGEDGKSLGMHIQETPFLCWYTWMTEMSHYYQTTPQIHGQKREIVYPRGNVIGGSSATNTMVYFRGSKFDYEHWENDLL